MYLKNILFLLIGYNVSYVLCKAQLRIPCTLDDYRCTTKAAKPLFNEIVNGIPDIGVPISDPLHQEVIYGFVRDMNYTLTDAHMYGMKDCDLKKHRLLAGFIGGNYIEGKGPCEITDDQYHMVISGGFEFYTGVDGESHMKITCFDFEELEVLKNVNYVFHNLYYGDEEKSLKMHKYLNENWKSVSSATHYPTLYAFIAKLIENLNIFLLAVPADEIFYRSR